MSDSLIAFQPAIEEPSNMTPSTNVLSSVAEAMRAVCCHLPQRIGEAEVNELDVLFLDHRENLFRVHLSLVPLLWLRPHAPRGRVLIRRRRHARQYEFRICIVDARHEDLAVADAARVRRAADRLDGLLDHLVLDDQLDLHLGQEVDDVFGAAIELGVALLAAEALGLQ